MSKLESVATGKTGKNKGNLPSVDTSKNLQRARHVYNIDGWGQNYYDISDEGNVIVKPLHQEGASINLLDIVEEAHTRNLKFPLLVRFQDILRHRVRVLNGAFQCAIFDCGYPGVYQGVFPAKVNQLREVIEEILDAGEEFHYGLEVGSKPELMAALAMQDSTSRLLICNGHKDPLYIRMAMLGLKLGKKVILVIEKFEELKQILILSKRLGVEPLLGIRLRLTSKGTGKWAESGGEKAKFGLNTPELMAAAELLIQNGLSHCLKLTHFHVGSQISDILPIKRAVQEGARFYCKLRQMGFQIEYFDVGGGLGVDYDGSSTAYDSSVNYTMQEYANNVVFYLMEICKSEGVECPTIVSESGRSVVAHHSVLLTDVLGSIEMARRWKEIKPDDSHHQLVKELLRLYDEVKEMNPLEAYHDALRYKEDSQDLFMLGMM
ncbi:MAG: biosynthetic arginine decarboxylase, partial [Verrucomicrobiota bacterium]|nr:biosynthetic arginine decarboxylase [Verrucomicrobiota bacterium]